MKLVLTDYNRENTERFKSSLTKAEIPFVHVNIQYDGFLAPDILNPFAYFMGYYQKPEKHRYFNQIPLPPFYEARNVDGGKSEILQGDNVVGHIFYQPNTNRLVKEVVWYNRIGKKVAVERYNIQGEKYADVIVDKDGKDSKVVYYQGSKPVIDFDLSSKNILLKKNGMTQSFNNLTEFVLYFIETIVKEKLGFDFDEVIYNNLATPLFVSNRLPQRATLYFQEFIKDEIPGNMVGVLAGRTPTKRILFENIKQLKKVETLIQEEPAKIPLDYLGAIEEFRRDNDFTQGALTITFSDQILHEDKLAEALAKRGKTWTIAAPSEVSDKLRNFSNAHDNINLLERINGDDIPELLAKHDFYLDVNRGAQMMNNIYRAYHEGMLVISDQKVSKNGGYEVVLVKEEELVGAIDRNSYTSLMNILRKKKGTPATREAYQAQFGA
ncbi:glycosyltransferase stabilizing protein Gtf2 [Lactococcus hodotermopsidis]|uniref:Glycosyltransferase stabilizing protein Gtf2 n=1 Tax=Pseudolactococcus hodotermopsidis TaxID=2709157 RepID=A0A6A0BFE6_9LACT|nr:hypothetical protein [Lactococcus hodotermopsidis]GFH43001.1 glycosyltransferase stabilizing protein Gtf2 [Lactococcus hodotermopsidis]